MTRRSDAPDAVLILRAVGSATLVLAYAALRVPQFNVSPIELALTWVGAVFALFVLERAASELHRRHIDRVELPTEVIPPVREWPDEVELTIAEARHEATHALVDRGVIAEHLFTHDVLCEPTPPRGFSVSDNEDAIRYATVEYTGRHRLADAQLTRERSGQFFGQL